MGSVFSTSWAKKANLVAHLRSDNRYADGKIIRSTVVGNHHWYVCELKSSGKRFIGLDLMKFYRGEGGYKDLDESMGPCYYDCPIGYLAIAGEPENDYAKEWREEVRKYHAKKKNLTAYSVGDKINFYGKKYELISSYEKVGKRTTVTWLARSENDGKVYRFSKTNLNKCEKVS